MYEKYAEIRDARGLTDNAVAAAAGIPISTMYDWRQRAAKNSAAGISVAYLKRIADLLEIKIDDLI